MSDDETEVAVVHSGDQDRYELTVDGQQAGFAEYVDRDGQRIFHHTKVGAEFGGRGLGSVLVGRALADTKAAGLRVVPVCSFVQKYLESHHDVDDIVDAVTPEAQAAVRQRTE